MVLEEFFQELEPIANVYGTTITSTIFVSFYKLNIIRD
jgi:hypothetical protein